MMEGIATAAWIAKAADIEGTSVRRKGFLKFVRWRREVRSGILRVELK
jgi:hypothetical protein